jgi:ribosomal protein S18 acetylase RimI-like enzyme
LWHALQLNNGLVGALRGLLLMLLIDNHHHPNKDEVYIEMLGVDPTWRGQGVAHQLIAHAEVVARQQQVSRLALAVVSDNLPALHLYEKMGFTTQTKQRSWLLKWITGHPGYYEMTKQLSTINS